MPIKEELVLPVGFSVPPKDSYIRLARVEQTSITTRNLIVRFIDGSRIEGEWVEPLATVVSVIGSPDPSTTYVPSAVVYGRGDLCAVMILENQEMYAVSPMDNYKNVNRENYPTLKGWALFDALGGINVDGDEDGENSFLTFWNPNTHITTKITGDPEKHRVFERMLLYYLREKTCNIPITTCDDSWNWDVARSGPDVNPEVKIGGRIHKGRYVNGFPYVEDTLFSNANTLESTFIAYSNTLEDEQTATPHPLVTGEVLNRFFDHARVIWFPDEDPTHVVLVGSYPTWESAQQIVFLEVPVYCLAGRKFLEREITDEDLPTEEKKIVQSWQMYGDQVRVLKTIQRSYIDWSAHETDVFSSERLHKSVSVFTPRPTGNTVTFGILDGYGWGQDGQVFSLNKLQRITGSIQRALINPSLEPYQNGSRYKYQIFNTNPIAAGHVEISHGVLFEYEFNGGAEWERQTSVNVEQTYPCYTDGTNTMHRTIDINYFCDGHYDPNALTGGTAAWNYGPDGTENVQDIVNDHFHHTFLNEVLRWTDSWQFRKNDTDGFYGDQTLYIMFYGDPEYDLFVHEKIVTTFTQGGCPSGPGTICVGTQTHYGIVMFLGLEYIIWEYVITLSVMPTVWNYWPWILSAGEPELPTSSPYSVSEIYNSMYWLEPQWDTSLGTVKSGLSSVGIGFPGPLFSAESLGQNSVVETADFSLPDELLRVNIDKDQDSFSVRWECYMEDDTDKVLTYPSGDTLFRFNGGLPHFNKPTATVTIDLMDNSLEEA